MISFLHVLNTDVVKLVSGPVSLGKGEYFKIFFLVLVGTFIYTVRCVAIQECYDVRYARAKVVKREAGLVGAGFIRLSKFFAGSPDYCDSLHSEEEGCVYIAYELLLFYQNFPFVCFLYSLNRKK